jgi:thiamine biosynthesis lipoprotein
MLVTRPLMGTVFRLTVPDGAPGPAVDEVFAWLEWVEATFSTFRPGSAISRIGAGDLDPSEAPTEVRHVLARCAELEEASGGRFAIRPGRLGGPGIDPAGFVKGWSVDEAAMLLRSRDIGDFSIYAGGDVLCGGVPPSGDRWRVAIRHPERPDEAYATVLEIAGGAVATSAAYYRGDHIRGSDRGDIASVTVIGPSLGVADALATAIFADQAESLDWMKGFPDFGVLLLGTDGMMRWTAPLDGLIADGGPGNRR